MVVDVAVVVVVVGTRVELDVGFVLIKGVVKKFFTYTQRVFACTHTHAHAITSPHTHIPYIHIRYFSSSFILILFFFLI